MQIANAEELRLVFQGNAKLKNEIKEMQAEYEARLKADLKAMLTEIQLDIEELKTDYDKNLTSEHDIYYAYDKSSRIVQNYINALKEKNNE